MGNADADKRKKEMIEARNDADTLIYSTEKSVNEHADKLEAADKEAVTTQIAEVRAAMEAEDLEDLKSKIEGLQQAAMKIGEVVYKNSGEGGEGGGEANDEGETVDVEGKEKKDEGEDKKKE